MCLAGANKIGREVIATTIKQVVNKKDNGDIWFDVSTLSTGTSHANAIVFDKKNSCPSNFIFSFTTTVVIFFVILFMVKLFMSFFVFRFLIL